ncbi:Exostosin family protein [Quillaja saponaria]|uniref:Exostosin family protein n=1 Tax=Quillaja saponaria TaxID=32244 RepID=A0AAD7KVR3_QUISA|nr:Exostosin family protein [Quillaja saponaria]
MPPFAHRYRRFTFNLLKIFRENVCFLMTTMCSSIVVFMIYVHIKSRYLDDTDNYMPYGNDEVPDVFHLPEAFKLDYAKMEKEFKIYMYPDHGDYHTSGKLTGKYASEGHFFRNLRESRFLTSDPNQAHLFFIPISCQKMRGKGLSYENMTSVVKNYVESLIIKFPYWNRTSGSDHFFVTCHDIGVNATKQVPFLVKNSIRGVCLPRYDSEYIPHKDFAVPQVLLPYTHPAGGSDLQQRTTLAFWAGRCDSDLRNELAMRWGNDTEFDIQNYQINPKTKGRIVYTEKLYRAKFCLCPRGSRFDTGSRIASSIHYGCVPVIMSRYHDLPFIDILDWRKFSVILDESDLQQLKDILKYITDERLTTLHENLVKVQKHFIWNTPPVSYDAFHMVMYDLWLRRHVINHRIRSHDISG